MNERADLGSTPEGVRHALVQQWNVPLRPDEHDWEVLRQRLTERVRFLLDHDLNRLMTGLYLLDVPESACHAALTAPKAVDASLQLADAILAREAEKAETRRRFTR